MQTLTLQARNNQDYQLTLDFSNWIAAGFDLSAASRIVMRAALAIGEPSVLLWSNAATSPAEGTISLIPSPTGSLTYLRFAAPVSLIATRIPNPATLVYDVRLTTATGARRILFGGTLQFLAGVTDGRE